MRENDRNWGCGERGYEELGMGCDVGGCGRCVQVMEGVMREGVEKEGVRR